MPAKMARSAPPTTVRAARSDGSCPNLAFILPEGRKTASIHANSGVIWGIPVRSTQGCPGTPEARYRIAPQLRKREMQCVRSITLC